MSMLQLSSVLFPQFLSSSSATLSQSSTTTPACMRNRRKTTEANSAIREETGRFSRSLARTPSRKGHLYCCNQVWTENGGRIPWNVTAMWENIQDLLAGGKTPYERRFGVPLNGPVIPSGAMVEYYLISGRDLSRLYQLGPKSLARYIPWICVARGWNLESRHIGRRHWGIGADGHIWNLQPP